MNKGGFSWKRFVGISGAKARMSRKIGIPLTRSGRHQKIGAGVFWTTRGGNGGPFTIGFLATFEILATLFFSEEFADQADVANWILVLHVVLVAAAVIAVIKTVIGARGSMRHATSG